MTDNEKSAVVDEKVNEAVDENIDEKVDEAVDENIGEKVDEAVDENIDEQIDEAVDENVDEKTPDAHSTRELEYNEDIPAATPVEQEGKEADVLMPATKVGLLEDKKVLGGIFAVIVVILLLGVHFSGILQPDDEEKIVVPEPSIFDFEAGTPATTYYHYDGGMDATKANDTLDLVDNNIPLRAHGSYYGIGTTTFEPTIGVTSTGSLFMTNHNGLGVGTHIIRSQDKGQSWEDMGPINQAYNSNDPYVYVDPWTDRIMKFDMHALLGMTIEYSDDEGENWMGPFVATGESPQDHQTVASSPVPDGFLLPVAYPTIYVYSINTGLQGGGVGGSYGENSFDGGRTWNHPELPHYEVGKAPASGLSGHLVGSEDGSFYRGQPAQGGPAAYRSLDGGFTWTEHVITSDMSTQTHEVAIGTDEASNVHACWIGDNNMPYYSFSTDQGNTWRDPIMVAPPGVNGTGFPTIAAGADGRAAFGYIGLNPEGTGWSGYLGIITDAHAENPLITTVAVNEPTDPLDTSSDCGYRRCGGFGDFIDICIDPEGRPWVAMAHNPSVDDPDEGTGIVGTFYEGPALRGDLDYLEPLVAMGGPSTL